MRHTEDLLPVDARFDTVLDELHGEVTDVTQEVLETYSDIINPINELSRAPQSLWALSGSVADVMKSKTEDHAAVQTAMYRGMCFALQVIDDIKSAPLMKITLPDELTNEQPEMAAVITEATNLYVASRPHIDELLGEFMPELDPTSRCHHHVETAALLMFMMCERECGEEYLRQTASQLQPDDFYGD